MDHVLSSQYDPVTNEDQEKQGLDMEMSDLALQVDPEPVLPGLRLVGKNTRWILPVYDEHIEVQGDFIAFASAKGPHDFQIHSPGKFAPSGQRCRGCRWSEIRIFREEPNPERYLIHMTMNSTVPNEPIRTRYEWASNGENVVAHLAIRGTNNYTVPAQIALTQASGYDQEIEEAWINAQTQE